MRGRGLRILGVCVLTFVQSCEIMEADGMPVGVVHLTERMEALSSAVLNGGDSVVSAVFIMQVSKNYDHPDPAAHADAVRRELGLPEDSLGMMTAAEVRHVFNVRDVGFEGAEVTAIATAGLSNHVVAGEVLDDYDEKSAVSAMRARALAGTINICVVSPVPLSTAGKVNLMIPLVEGKSVAMAEHGFLETGTTSDSMAVISPIGEGRVDWTGTGSNIGIAAARAVSAWPRWGWMPTVCAPCAVRTRIRRGTAVRWRKPFRRRRCPPPRTWSGPPPRGRIRSRRTAIPANSTFSRRRSPA